MSEVEEKIEREVSRRITELENTVEEDVSRKVRKEVETARLQGGSPTRRGAVLPLRPGAGSEKIKSVC